MEFFTDIALFSVKSLVIVLSIIVVLFTIAAIIARNKLNFETVKVINLNEKYENFEEQLSINVLPKAALKKLLKQKKKQHKAQEELKKSSSKVFVIDFHGDIKASHVTQLRDEVSAILTVADPKDEVVLNIESPGGMVHSYGLAAAQILRLKKSNIPVTVTVDKVAASGGYMMACVANKIIAAPFAIVGSIGVLAQVPNFNRLLKKNNIDYEEITAGEYKRTISIFGEITEKGREKFNEDINLTHQLFKDWVFANRPQLKMDEVATGEHWYGTTAIKMGLIDEIMTSDEHILSLCKSKKVYKIQIKAKKTLSEKLTEAAGTSISRSLPEWVMQLQHHKWWA